MSKIEENQGCFSRMIGEQLSAVSFVMDYLQLQFNAHILTVLTPLVVHVGDQAYRLGDRSYRDTLCEKITHDVKEVVLAEDHLRIGFNDGTAFSISLKEADCVGAEAIIFQFPESERMQMLVIHGAA